VFALSANVRRRRRCVHRVRCLDDTPHYCRSRCASIRAAQVFEEKQTECADAGIDGFLCKPLRLDTLRAALTDAQLLT
jgi:hypothetical protein